MHSHMSSQCVHVSLIINKECVCVWEVLVRICVLVWVRYWLEACMADSLVKTGTRALL